MILLLLVAALPVSNRVERVTRGTLGGFVRSANVAVLLVVEEGDGESERMERELARLPRRLKDYAIGRIEKREARGEAPRAPALLLYCGGRRIARQEGYLSARQMERWVERELEER